MKKIFLVIMAFMAFLLIGCGEVTLELKETEIVLTVGDVYEINPVVEGINVTEIYYELSNDNLGLDGNKITALKKGETSVKVGITGKDVFKTLNVEIKDQPSITINGNNKIVINEEVQLELVLVELEENATWESSDDSILSVNNGLVKGLKEGKATVTAKIRDYSASLEIEVVKPLVSDINIINLPSLLYVGDNYILDYQTLPEYSLNDVVITSLNDSLQIDGNEIIAIKAGMGVLELKAADESNFVKQVEIEVQERPDVTLKGPEKIIIDQEEKLTWEITNVTGDLEWKSSDDSIATIIEGTLKGISEGEVTITLVVGNLSCEIKVVVVKPLVTDIKVSNDELEMFVGDEVNIDWTVEPLKALQEVDVTVEGDMVTVVGKKVTAVKEGNGKIIISSKDGSNISKEIIVKVTMDNMPEVKYTNEYKEKETVNYGESFDFMKGIQVIDDIDGDITSKVKSTTKFNNKKYGTQTIKFTVTDSGNNVLEFSREVEVVWNYEVQFIGHAGSYYGLMNSEEAILYAAEVLHYQAIEVDIKQTSDGVFVLSHDDTFNGITIANKTWDELKDVTYTSGRNAGYPSQNGSVTNSPYTTKLCTLERFLEICKEYGVRPVIELKSSKGITNSDQSRMGALMKEIEKAGMLDEAILLGSQYNCLIWTRNNGYETVECQYLVNSCESETALNRCIQYNLDISINVTGSYTNSEEWIARYHEAGLKVSTYTYTQYVNYNVVQEWIDKGVEFVTCDWHIMEQLNLPKSSADSGKTYEVKFYDLDGNLLKSSIVKHGRTAATPSDPVKPGYDFTGWDKSVRNVTQDLEVYPTYQIINYSIQYQDNLSKVEKTSWANKNEFINEFYGDLLAWFNTNGSRVPGLTKSGNTITISKNGVKVTFSTVADILAMDIYDFEKTISNSIYKPVTRNSDDSCVIEPSEDYFLNSDAYRLKYQALDAWFVNCINKSYTKYDKTYKPLSDGRIQIMFRFHQWVKGTNIAPFNTLPDKYNVVGNSNLSGTVTLPTSPTSYTINDEVILPEPTSNLVFLGWYLDEKCTGERVTKIAKGTTGNIVLYAKWQE